MKLVGFSLVAFVYLFVIVKAIQDDDYDDDDGAVLDHGEFNFEEEIKRRPAKTVTITLTDDELKMVDSVRAATGYSWQDRQRFMERYICRGKCIESFYSKDTTIRSEWDEKASECICGINPTIH